MEQGFRNCVLAIEKNCNLKNDYITRVNNCVHSNTI